MEYCRALLYLVTVHWEKFPENKILKTMPTGCNCSVSVVFNYPYPTSSYDNMSIDCLIHTIWRSANKTPHQTLIAVCSIKNGLCSVKNGLSLNCQLEMCCRLTVKTWNWMSSHSKMDTKYKEKCPQTEPKKSKVQVLQVQQNKTHIT